MKVKCNREESEIKKKTKFNTLRPLFICFHLY